MKLKRIEQGSGARITAQGTLRHHNTEILRLIESQPDWMLDGLCNEVGTDWFYPEVGSHAPEAKRVCRKCPVIEDCLKHAIVNGEAEGVWGGLSAHERKPLWSRYRRDRANQLLDAGWSVAAVAARMDLTHSQVRGWRDERVLAG